VNTLHIDDLLAAALRQCEQGAFDQAQATCLKVLQLAPQNDQAMNQLGVIAYHLQKYNEAITWWQQVLVVYPRSLITHINMGMLFYEQQQYDKALTSFTNAVAIEPNNVTALSNKANTLLALNQFSNAIDLYQALSVAHEDRLDLQSNKGFALFKNNQFNEAELVFVDILNKQSNYLPALVNYSNLLLATQKHDQGISVCNQGLAHSPTSIILLLNKAHFYLVLGDKQQALTAYDQILTIEPSNIAAMKNRAAIYLQLKKYSSAFQDLKKVLLVDDKNIEVLSNYAYALSGLRQYEKAVDTYNKALTIKPDEWIILMNRAAALSGLSRHNEAIEDYKKALNLHPHNDNIAVLLMQESQHICDWSDFYNNIEVLKTIIAKPSVEDESLIFPGSIFPFMSLVFPNISPIEQLQCAKKYINFYFSDYSKLKHNQHHKSSKLSIGYLSGDFRRHAVSQLMVEVFELHNRDQFTVIAFSYGVDDGSQLRARVQNSVDHFIDISQMDDVQAASAIANMNVDVLIDLSGHTADARTAILAQKPAHIQMSYLGYLGTTGADFIDYLIADSFLVHPKEEKFYAEQIRYLPSYQANDRQCDVGETPSRRACGLPEEAIVFCCFNVQYKITPIVFAVWCRLLLAVPNSVLWLFATNAEAKINLIKEAQLRGIDASRLIFAEVVDLPAHLGRLKCADIFLDTTPYNAGTTASNALWVGLPVVTCAGDTFASRMAGSLLTALDIPELITYNLGDYYELALQLATDSEKRQRIAQQILSNKITAKLFDTPALTASLEAIYQHAVSIKT
jgi:predicted O-linked N-acetylglucosamine transferase (SPINDLY family)